MQRQDREAWQKQLIEDQLVSPLGVQMLFDKLDLDKNGFLSRAEVVEGARILKITEEQADRVFDTETKLSTETHEITFQ